MPSGEKETKNTVWKKRLNIGNLIRRWAQENLGKKWIIDPTVYPLVNRDETIRDIRSKIIAIYKDENWDDTPIEEVENIKDSTILAEIEIFASSIRSARRLAPKRFYRTFPKLRESVTENELTKAFISLNENELTDLYASRANMKRFLKQKFGISPDVLITDMSGFQRIFASETLKMQNPSLYKKIERAIIEYENHGRHPLESTIGEIFAYYTDQKKKSEICEYFWITFTFKDAKRYGLIDKDDMAYIAEKYMAPTWQELNQRDKDRILQALETDPETHMNLTLEDLHEEKWTEFLERDTSEAIIARELGRILAESEGKNLPSEHTGWLEQWSEDATIRSKIQNIGSWTESTILVFEDRSGMPHYFRIEQTDIDVGSLVNPWLRLVSLEWLTAGTVGLPKGESDISYEEMDIYLKDGVKSGTIMTQDELMTKTDKNKEETVDEGGILGLKTDEKVWDVSDVEDLTTIEALTNAINRVDPEGKAINDGKIAPGIAFLSRSAPDKDGKSEEWVYKIKKLQNGLITITGSNEWDETASYADFIKVIDTQKLTRIALLDPEREDEAMIQTLGKYGINIDNTILEDGDLVTEIETHEDDGHGHSKTKKSRWKYEYFRSENGGHIRLGGMKDGFVFFGEYENEKTFDDVKKIHKSKKLSEKQKKWLYKWRTVSYGSFLYYLEKNKLKATTENLLSPDADNTHEPHEHLEGNLFSKIGKLYSIGDIIKWVTNWIHHIEHYFEKTSKLNASRVTLGLAKKLWLPDDIIAQAQSEEVTSVKEIIDKLKDKLGNLNGPHGRNKALHIAHNKDARPEEVGAAMLHMVRGYGQLYAEDIAYAQGSYSFLNGFLNACGFKDESSRKEMRQKSREKFLADMGNEGGEPTEEEIIWGFMKTMDGKYDEYPIAGTVVKAMWGPSGWEKAWRTEGFEGAYEKWKRQGDDTVNAKGRVNKWLSALITHEYNSAIGFIESAAWKDPDPSIQTIPVVWALAGYSQYLGTKASQRVKGFGDSKGHTFHAYAFLRNKEDNDIFKAWFRLALSDIAPEKVKELDKHIATLQRDYHNNAKDNEAVKEAVYGIANIWNQYQNRGLHDALQGKNGWLIEKINTGNVSAKKYLERINGIHRMNGSETIPPDNDWMMQYGYNSSPLIEQKELDGKTVLSLERTLKKIRINAHNYDLDKDKKDRLWPSIIERMTQVKDIQDPELRKSQYNQYRADILKWFRDAINVRTWDEAWALENLKKKSYYKDLQEMGIKPELIIEGGETEKLIRTTSGEDLTMWLWGGRWSGNYRHESVREIIEDTSKKTGARMYQQWVTSKTPTYREEWWSGRGDGLYVLSEDSDN